MIYEQLSGSSKDRSGGIKADDLYRETSNAKSGRRCPTLSTANGFKQEASHAFKNGGDTLPTTYAHGHQCKPAIDSL